MQIILGKFFQTFSIDNVSSEIEEVKAFIGNQEVSLDKPYQVEGTASGNVSIKGRVKGKKSLKQFLWKLCILKQ